MVRIHAGQPFYTGVECPELVEGPALGLSICKRVMQAHGGDIVLERHEGSGAVFVLTFPIARREPDAVPV